MDNVQILVEELMLEDTISHLTRGWVTNFKANMISSDISKAYHDWQQIKKELLKNIEENKDLDIKLDLFTTSSKLFGWRFIFLLVPKYINEVTNNIKNGDSTAGNLDFKARDVMTAFGNPKKVGDLKKAVEQADKTLKSYLTLSKTKKVSFVNRSIISGSIGDFVTVLNRIVNSSR